MSPKLHAHKIIREITRRSEWTHFLKEVGAYDVYHTYDYHLINQSKGDQSVLLAYDDGLVKVGLPLIVRKIPGSVYYDATSVYGFPGPVTKGIRSSFCNLSFIEGLDKYFKTRKIVSVFSRLNPFMGNQSLVLQNFGHFTNQGEIVVIDTSRDPGIQRSGYNKRLKTYVNHARKACNPIIAEKNLKNIRVFMDLYYKTMDRVGASKRYYFPEGYFMALFCGQGYNIELLQVKEKGSNTVVSSGILMYAQDIAHYHLSGTDASFSDLSPTKLLIDEMRILVTRRKCKLFNLGGGVRGNRDSLFYFKSAFSKDNYKSFLLWKHVVLPDVYDQLVEENGLCSSGTEYFPKYRGLEN